jgi:hypothetical protein
MLQNAPFGGWNKREAVNPVDDLNVLHADFNLFDQRGNDLPSRRPVRLFQTALDHFPERLRLSSGHRTA